MHGYTCNKELDTFKTVLTTDICVAWFELYKDMKNIMCLNKKIIILRAVFIEEVGLSRSKRYNVGQQDEEIYEL